MSATTGAQEVVGVDDPVLAVDLGGTLTKLGLIDVEGRVLDERTEPTDRSGGPAGTLDGLLAAMTRFVAGRPVRGFGVVVPGIIDAAGGVVQAAANLGWYDLPLRARIAADLGLPGAVAHDVRSAGLAEWRLGDHTAVRDLLFVSLGTGIAGAMVADGRLIDAGGYAGELGHVAVPAAAGHRCPCGQRGCLETVASAAGVTRTYARLGGDPQASAATVADRARSGEEPALAAFELVSRALTEGLVGYVTLLGPEVVIIGGGLAGAADLLLPALDTALAGRLTFQRRPRLAVARLGARAGLIGAGLVGWGAPGPVA